ncbi:MAG TPA: anaerobic sulfatase-maturation protein [Terriglobales bacterium]|nr:anaerobic sulfatase-maturation protein [Terriglobales bacterium]
MTTSPMNSFQMMAKPTGALCNLDCSYCFYLEKEKLYPSTSNWAMSDAVLESYIRRYIESQTCEVVTFAWQGGEPTLLGISWFENVLALQRKYANGKRIENALQTNGVTLDESWGEFLAAHDFLVGVSIDGPRELHDMYRVDKGRQPTFDRVMCGIEHLKAAGARFNTLTVVNRKNSYHPLEVYRFLKEIGSGFMQFIPVIERQAKSGGPDGLVLIHPKYKGTAEVTDWSVEPEAYGNFICAIFDEWVRNDVGKFSVQLFDVTLELWLGMPPSLCVFAETCGDALALEHQGDLYSCDHYVYPENKLGNILENPLASIVQSEQQRDFGQAKRDSLPVYCKNCDVRFACNGECPKHRFAMTPDGEPGLNYLCAAYKKFFHHVAPYMEFMGRELLNHRPPSTVMEYARWVDDQMLPHATNRAAESE